MPAPNLSELFVRPDDSVEAVMRRISSAAQKGLPGGIALVVSAEGRLHGVVTDGDIRRALLSGFALDASIDRVMTIDPIVFPATMTYRQILDEIPRRLADTQRYRGGVMEKVILVDEESRVSRVLDFFELWRNQSARHRRVAVVGLGFVGLTLAVTLAEAGFQVDGIEADPRVRDLLGSGKAHFHEVGLEALVNYQLGRNLHIHAEPSLTSEIYILAVATPLGPDKRADLTHVRMAARQIGRVLSYGDLVIQRSTCPVGVCRNELLPILEAESGMQCGRDFFLAVAPERTVEGRALAELRSLPQVIGGYDENSADMTANLFRDVTPLTVLLSSLEAAEMVKLVNNSFRDLTFAFSNELAMICEHYNLNAAEIVNGANRGYPRDRVPVPSPGVGGVCLKKDPYLYAQAAHASQLGEVLPLRGRAVNEAMPRLLVDKLRRHLERLGKTPSQATFHLIGFAFKGEPETSDLRDSTTLDLLHLLQGQAGEIRGHDPVVPREELAKLGVLPVGFEDGFAGADCAIVLNNHRSYGQADLYSCLQRMNRPALYCDFWNVFPPDQVKQIDGISYVGLGFSV